MTSPEYPTSFHNSDKLFHAVVGDMHELYDHQITERDAVEAARNLIGFCQILLEIKRDNGHT